MSLEVQPDSHVLGLLEEFGISDKHGNPRTELDQRISSATIQRTDFWISHSKSDTSPPHVSVWTVPKNALGRALKGACKSIYNFLFNMKEAEDTEIQALYKSVTDEKRTLSERSAPPIGERSSVRVVETTPYTKSLESLEKVLNEIRGMPRAPTDVSLPESVPVIKDAGPPPALQSQSLAASKEFREDAEPPVADKRIKPEDQFVPAAVSITKSVPVMENVEDTLLRQYQPIEAAVTILEETSQSLKEEAVAKEHTALETQFAHILTLIEKFKPELQKAQSENPTKIVKISAFDIGPLEQRATRALENGRAKLSESALKPLRAAVEALRSITSTVEEKSQALNGTLTQEASVDTAVDLEAAYRKTLEQVRTFPAASDSLPNIPSLKETAAELMTQIKGFEKRARAAHASASETISQQHETALKRYSEVVAQYGQIVSQAKKLSIPVGELGPQVHGATDAAPLNEKVQTILTLGEQVSQLGATTRSLEADILKTSSALQKTYGETLADCTKGLEALEKINRQRAALSLTKNNSVESFRASVIQFQQLSADPSPVKLADLKKLLGQLSAAQKSQEAEVTQLFDAFCAARTGELEAIKASIGSPAESLDRQLLALKRNFDSEGATKKELDEFSQALTALKEIGTKLTAIEQGIATLPIDILSFATFYSKPMSIKVKLQETADNPTGKKISDLNRDIQEAEESLRTALLTKERLAQEQRTMDATIAQWEQTFTDYLKGDLKDLLQNIEKLSSTISLYQISADLRALFGTKTVDLIYRLNLAQRALKVNERAEFFWKKWIDGEDISLDDLPSRSEFQDGLEHTELTSIPDLSEAVKKSIEILIPIENFVSAQQGAVQRILRGVGGIFGWGGGTQAIWIDEHNKLVSGAALKDPTPEETDKIALMLSLGSELCRPLLSELPQARKEGWILNFKELQAVYTADKTPPIHKAAQAWIDTLSPSEKAAPVVLPVSQKAVKVPEAQREETETLVEVPAVLADEKEKEGLSEIAAAAALIDPKIVVHDIKKEELAKEKEALDKPFLAVSEPPVAAVEIHDDLVSPKKEDVLDKESSPASLIMPEVTERNESLGQSTPPPPEEVLSTQADSTVKVTLLDEGAAISVSVPPKPVGEAEQEEGDTLGQLGKGALVVPPLSLAAVEGHGALREETKDLTEASRASEVFQEGAEELVISGQGVTDTGVKESAREKEEADIPPPEVHTEAKPQEEVLQSIRETPERKPLSHFTRARPQKSHHDKSRAPEVKTRGFEEVHEEPPLAAAASIPEGTPRVEAVSKAVRGRPPMGLQFKVDLHDLKTAAEKQKKTPKAKDDRSIIDPKTKPTAAAAAATAAAPPLKATLLPVVRVTKPEQELPQALVRMVRPNRKMGLNLPSDGLPGDALSDYVVKEWDVQKSPQQAFDIALNILDYPEHIEFVLGKVFKPNVDPFKLLFIADTLAYGLKEKELKKYSRENLKDMLAPLLVAAFKACLDRERITEVMRYITKEATNSGSPVKPLYDLIKKGLTPPPKR